MDGAQQYETILTERLGLVERITLNRPEKRNALSPLLQVDSSTRCMPPSAATRCG